MKQYIQVLDLVTFCLIVLAISFLIKHDIIVESHMNRAGMMRTMVISWQSLIVVAAFCSFLRFIAQRVERAV